MRVEIELKKVFSDVFDVEPALITKESSPDNLPTWDSLSHTNLIVALEETFNINFTSDEMMEMLNFELIKIIIDEKISNEG